MPQHNATGGLTRIIRAFGYSFQGIRACYRHEAAFRQEVWAAMAVVPLGLWLGQGGVEKALLAGSWLIVLIIELINSAIESVVDRLGQEYHELSGRAKDAGSASVLLSISVALLVWASILLPRLL